MKKDIEITDVRAGFDQLIESIEKIEIGIEEIINQLHSLLSRSDKTYKLTYRKKLYDFIVPTTKKEKDDMFKLRSKFIRSILRNTIGRNITSSRSSWDDITGFALGADPKNYQFEKIEFSEIEPQLDADGNKILHKQIDTGSPYLLQQNENLTQEEMEEAIAKRLGMILKDDYVESTEQMAQE